MTDLTKNDIKDILGLGNDLTTEQETFLKQLTSISNIDIKALQSQVDNAVARLHQTVTKRAATKLIKKEIIENSESSTVITGDQTYTAPTTYDSTTTHNATVILSDGSEAASTEYVDEAISNNSSIITIESYLYEVVSTPYSIGIQNDGWDSVNSILHIDVLAVKCAYVIDTENLYTIKFSGFFDVDTAHEFTIYNKTSGYANVFDVGTSITAANFKISTNKASVNAGFPNIQKFSLLGATQTQITNNEHHFWFDQRYVTGGTILL